MTEPQCIEYQQATWEALRRLGFPASEIFIAFHGDRLFTELHTAGVVFRIEVAYDVTDRKGYGERWALACERWNHGVPESERLRIFEALPAGWHLGLLAALEARGLKPPPLAH